MAASRQPWKPEWEVNLDLAVSLVADQFPQLAPVEAEVLGKGWDNLAVLVNREFVFRFPQRRIAAKVMESELAVLPHLAPRLEMRIPSLQFVGRATTAFPYSFGGYPQLRGETACGVAISESQRGRAAIPLGRFLSSLHAHDEQQAIAWGAPYDELGRLDIPRRTRQGSEDLQRLENDSLLHIFSCDLFAGFLAAIEADPPIPADGVLRPRSLVHGDLYMRHLLVDATGDLTGVIDWGDVHCGDPAIDLAAGFCYFSDIALDDFLTAYGPVDLSMRRLAMMRAIQHTTRLIVYADEVEDKPLLFAALDSMARLESHLLEGDFGCSTS